MAKVSFIGIGAQKCASTWLYGILGQLPDVYVSDPKELDFFSSFFDHGYEWYERHFAEGSDRLHRGEVSPSYFIDRDTPERVHAYNPDMRILVTLRDPVERAYSNHLHEVRAGHLSGDNLLFEAGLENNPLYRNQGLYAQHLARWFETFPAGQIHVTFQEDVKAQSDMEAASVSAFLGLDAPTAFVQRRANESTGYHNQTLGSALWRVGKAARRAGMGATIESIKKLPVVRQIRQANQKDIRSEVAPMLKETDAKLADFFRDDVARLSEMLGRPVPWKRFG